MNRFIRKETFEKYMDAFGIRQPRQQHRHYKYSTDLDILLNDENIQLEVTPIMNRSGSEGVLIGVVDELVYATRFSVGSRLANKDGQTKPAICDLCKTQQDTGGVRLVSFPKKDTVSEHDSVAHLCCADLFCSLNIRDLTPQGMRSRVFLRETEFVDGQQKPLSTERRIIRLKNSLTTLFENLGVEPILIDLDNPDKGANKTSN